MPVRENTSGNKRVEQGNATRAALIDVARQLFAEKGYNGTSIDDLVLALDVTRGALYHHFKDKTALFRAVFEQLEAEIVSAVVEAAAGGTGPLEQLQLGLDAFLERCLDPAVQRIVLLEGPSVLGWQEWHEIDTQYGFGVTVAGLQAAMDAGAIEKQPVEPLAHLLLGAVVQGGMVLARAENPAAEREAFRAPLFGFLQSLAPQRGPRILRRQR